MAASCGPHTAENIHKYLANSLEVLQGKEVIRYVWLVDEFACLGVLLTWACVFLQTSRFYQRDLCAYTFQ